ncbi:hypothetical protein [Streptomyces cylindrosporus]|uniref:Secreted protein n=1 Tax=Streptomyces cylindrosporus TaxID=2927583 RepID=A0ABS9Y6L5_9ACTN|nr:hypothetical protein [Streptomyces cylindrosporus]MCI3272872.1 hypothetical protein [Streptomyces cylindrosporus]
MRTIRRGSCAAGLVAVVLAAGLTACSGGDKSDDEGAKACSKGTYAWSDVRRTQKLTALADPIVFKKKTASYTSHLKPVGDTVYRPKVTGVPTGATAAGVIKQLGAYLKVEEPLADPSEAERPAQDEYFETTEDDLKGAYYSWAYVGLVDADFTYTCGSDEPVKGHVLTWDTTGSGFLSCDIPADQASGRAAARKTCPEGSKAAKAA